MCVPTFVLTVLFVSSWYPKIPSFIVSFLFRGIPLAHLSGQVYRRHLAWFSFIWGSLVSLSFLKDVSTDDEFHLFCFLSGIFYSFGFEKVCKRLSSPMIYQVENYIQDRKSIFFNKYWNRSINLWLKNNCPYFWVIILNISNSYVKWMIDQQKIRDVS